MGAVDDILPVTLYEALEAALNVVGVLVVVSLVEPILIAPSVVVVVALLAIRNLYLLTARNIKRMEGLGKRFNSYFVFKNNLYHIISNFDLSKRECLRPRGFFKDWTANDSRISERKPPQPPV